MPCRLRSLRACFVGLVLTGFALPALAQVPQATSFTGRLVDDLGNPLPGPVDLELRVFDMAAAGALLYSELHLETTLGPTGVFSVQLGLGTNPSGTFGTALFADADRWLEVVVDGDVLSPRERITSVPWALRASEADTLGGLSPADLLRASHSREVVPINDFAAISFTAVLSTTADAPGDGLLMIWASLNAEYDFDSAGANADLECRIAVDGVAESILVDQEFASIPTGVNSGESVSIDTVVPVAVGNRDIDLECRVAGSGQVFIKARSLSTLYVPFGDVSP
jgi:hypothetical protein